MEWFINPKKNQHLCVELKERPSKCIIFVVVILCHWKYWNIFYIIAVSWQGNLIASQIHENYIIDSVYK